MTDPGSSPAPSRLIEPQTIDDFLVLRLRRVAVAAADGPGWLYERELGISRRDLRVLGLIRDQPGMTSGALATLLNVSAVLASRTVSALAAEGLVRKVRNRDDARSIELALSEKGESVYARGLQLGVAFNRELASCLSDEEAGLLDALLRRLEERALKLSEREKAKFMTDRKR
ncbi:MarR family winged helix-turn-helix transcriptional regulator [Paraburkholderia sp. J67]|uniref:MarR family winged helix-turn-helix transcriptional regulator n=1 Tax=Paraburkholderia sp. J67 TaxID=2805435 RepID=UPI002ABD689C|nr:MarR family transcriptional regulator [Paraburkholderia sp. J67]